MLPVYREDLDGASCSTPGCDHTSHDGLFLTPKCHIAAPVTVEYRDGVLHVRCAACKRQVVEIAVASEAKASACRG